MKTTFKVTKLLALALILTVFGCSSDDNGDGDPGLTAQNLVANFDENPANGESVGTIQASGGGTLSFSITSQTPAGALGINASNGELTVANATLFDFETNPVVTANVTVSDGTNTATGTATINLNDLDDIASFLSTSEAAYTAAADGDWVAITGAEYVDLATSLNAVDKIATTDAQYSIPVNNFIGLAATIINNNGITMPANSFVFAVKYNALNDTGTGIKIKQSSTSESAGYSDLGGTLTSNVAGDNFYVLKGNNTAVPAVGYLAIFDPSGSDIGASTSVAGSQALYDAGDSSTVNTFVDMALIYYQGLSSTQKQW